MKKGRIYINKDGVNKVIDPIDKDKYLEDGWVLGNTNAATMKNKTRSQESILKLKETYKKKREAKINNLLNRISKEDLIDFYINYNNSLEDTMEHFNITSSQMILLLSQYHIHKPAKLANELTQKTKLERYGASSYNNREKAKNTCIDKYGVENPFQSNEIKDKIKSTMIEKYGVDHPMQNIDIAKKMSSHHDYASEKIKREETCLKKYGVTNAAKALYVRQKLSDSMSSLKVRSKVYDTKKRNSTFNISQPEEDYYDELVKIYGKDNIIRQYKEDRYPFACDFYIKPLDLFIELNKCWTHYSEPFDVNNSEHLAILETWKEKAKDSDYYKNAIYTWTILDVKKAEVAKQNNLNYLVIY